MVRKGRVVLEQERAPTGEDFAQLGEGIVILDAARFPVHGPRSALR